MKLLTVLSGYNRYYLLKNTIESFFAYGPETDLLVVDDCSDDPRVISYLQEIERRPGVRVIRKDRWDRQYHGGLYDSMNRGIDVAAEGGYSHVFFIQDDMQFMWRDPQFLQRVEAAFKALPDAAQVVPNFMKAIIAASMRKRLIAQPGLGCWHMTPYAISDIGVVPVSLLKESGWKFGSTEGGNNKEWYEKGYKQYTLAAPTIAWVPWAETIIAGKRMGKIRAPRREFLLKPLSTEQIERLKKTGGEDIPWHEDYCLPWGWRCVSPYWFTKWSDEYWKRLWECMRAGERWPRIVGVR